MLDPGQRFKTDFFFCKILNICHKYFLLFLLINNIYVIISGNQLGRRNRQSPGEALPVPLKSPNNVFLNVYSTVVIEILANVSHGY